MTGRDPRKEGGFVAVELVAGLALLIVPVALVVLTLPRWSERQVTARAIGREVARRTARDAVCDFDEARRLTALMARNLGVPDTDVVVELECADGSALAPGADIEVGVTIAMPAVQMPVLGAIGGWSWTVRHREPVDRYVGAR